LGLLKDMIILLILIWFETRLSNAWEQTYMAIRWLGQLVSLRIS